MGNTDSQEEGEQQCHNYQQGGGGRSRRRSRAQRQTYEVVEYEEEVHEDPDTEQYVYEVPQQYVYEVPQQIGTRQNGNQRRGRGRHNGRNGRTQSQGNLVPNAAQPSNGWEGYHHNRGGRGRGQQGHQGGHQNHMQYQTYNSTSNINVDVTVNGVTVGKPTVQHSHGCSKETHELTAPYTLINTLMQQQNLRASLLYLLENHQYDLPSVRKLVSGNPHLFKLEGEVVVLKLDVQICNDHNGSQGCQRRTLCNDLHICSKYVTKRCQKQDCILGHNWRTNHNGRILKAYDMDHLSSEFMEKILMSSDSVPTSKGPLDICAIYNKVGCYNRECPDLHICRSFVTGFFKCSRNNCKKNHDILIPYCRKLLKASGINVNETPRDVLAALMKVNPSLKNQ